LPVFPNIRKKGRERVRDVKRRGGGGGKCDSYLSQEKKGGKKKWEVCFGAREGRDSKGQMEGGQICVGKGERGSF